jgi:hypothetical protein
MISRNDFTAVDIDAVHLETLAGETGKRGGKRHQTHSVYSNAKYRTQLDAMAETASRV